MNGTQMSLPMLLVAVCILAYAPQASAVCQRFPVPDASRVVIVSNDMLVNGVPMSVSELHSKRSTDEVARFYRSDWEGRRQRVVESNEGGWRTLATKDGDCFYTVQIKPGPDQGTYALLGVTLLGVPVARARGDGFPKMGGSVVYNDMLSNDSGKNGRTLLLKNNFSAEANAQFYRNSMRNDGWVSITDQVTKTPTGAQMVQVWRRGVAEANLVIGGNKAETQVVVNMVDRP